jgi:hypothetical protein
MVGSNAIHGWVTKEFNTADLKEEKSRPDELS